MVLLLQHDNLWSFHYIVRILLPPSELRPSSSRTVYETGTQAARLRRPGSLLLRVDHVAAGHQLGREGSSLEFAHSHWLPSWGHFNYRHLLPLRYVSA